MQSSRRTTGGRKAFLRRLRSISCVLARLRWAFRLREGVYMYRRRDRDERGAR